MIPFAESIDMRKNSVKSVGFFNQEKRKGYKKKIFCLLLKIRNSCGIEEEDQQEGEWRKRNRIITCVRKNEHYMSFLP